MKLVECPKTGEQCLVESLEGYEGWVVLSEDATPPSNLHCKWCCDKKGWVEDEHGAAKAQLRAKIFDREGLLDLIDELIKRIAALEAKVK